MLFFSYWTLHQIIIERMDQSLNAFLPPYGRYFLLYKYEVIPDLVDCSMKAMNPHLTPNVVTMLAGLGLASGARN